MPKDARPTLNLRPHKINNKLQGFPGTPVHQVFTVLIQNNSIFYSYRSQDTPRNKDSATSTTTGIKDNKTNVNNNNNSYHCSYDQLYRSHRLHKDVSKEKIITDLVRKSENQYDQT